MSAERITKNVKKQPDGCWVWQKSCNSAGYGQLTINKRYWLAHRYSFLCHHGELSDSDLVRHLCHNSRCCNPDHLAIGNYRDNWRDSEGLHRRAAARRRGKWVIGGRKYGTVREASAATGMHQATIIKYTKDGVFDEKAYAKACLIANRKNKLL